MKLEQSFINGIGSLPVSAILPANTDIMLGTFLLSTESTVLTWSVVIIAVIFNLIPLLFSSFINFPMNIPFELTTGIFT